MPIQPKSMDWQRGNIVLFFGHWLILEESRIDLIREVTMTHALRNIVTAPLWGAVLIAVACSGGDGSGPSEPPAVNPPPGANAVNIGDNFYDPSAKSVGPGGTITWTWNGSNPHSVTFDAGGPSSTVKTTGTFARTFAAAGQFTYFCTVHGAAVMSGTVTVQ
jgi:plastocyanin